MATAREGGLMEDTEERRRKVIKYEQGKHKCPRHGCDRQVPNAMFACPDDWRALSRLAKAKIVATARRNVLDPRRREAFRAAEEAWGGSR